MTEQPAKQEAIYKFAMVKGSAEDSKAQQAFIRYLSRSSGYSFKLVSLANNSRSVEQLGNDDVQFALLSTISLTPAMAEYGVQPLAKAAPPLHQGDVQALFVVPLNSPLTKLIDIKGQSLALGDKGSLSSALIPLVTLANKNILLEELGQLSYTGSNKHCINSVLDNTADVCAVSAAFAKPYIESNQVRIIAASSYYPSNSVASNLYVEEEAQKNVLQALLQLTLVHQHLSLTNSVIPNKFLPINAKDYTPLSDAFIRLKLNQLGE
ncbi:MAG: phosphate/phosphite/phosphonate ABC transporter substrate-binding protein [Cycloclasticus sp.]|nr:phosphate/phosphite/phosphonate ABC transporter substrate-binding protein [Cycloclasticus sp.]